MSRTAVVNVARIKRLWDRGMRASAIGRELGCSPCTVSYWREKLGWPLQMPQCSKHYQPPSPRVVLRVCPGCGYRIGPAGHPNCPESVASILPRVLPRKAS